MRRNFLVSHFPHKHSSTGTVNGSLTATQDSSPCPTPAAIDVTDGRLRVMCSVPLIYMFDPNLSQMCNCSSFQKGSFNTVHCVFSGSRPATSCDKNKKPHSQVLEVDHVLGCPSAAWRPLWSFHKEGSVHAGLRCGSASGQLPLFGCREVGSRQGK